MRQFRSSSKLPACPDDVPSRVRPRRLTVVFIGLLAIVVAALLPAVAPSASAAAEPDSPQAGYAMPAVIPAPQSMTMDNGDPFVMTPGTEIDVHGDGALAVGNYLAALLRPSTGYPLPVSAVPGGKPAIDLRIADVGLGSEGYVLEAGPNQVLIRASTPEGLFHGVQTLRQLLPPEVESRTVQQGQWTVPPVHITDQSRFAWRGSMLDVARNFFTVQQVEQYIDMLALYKVNILHLHLSDDQGWRLQIKGWPQLTTVGAATSWGGGPGGYYTQDQYSQIVRYAAKRYITIVPEFDLPGHSTAARASYPALDCTTTVCVHSPATYQFLDDVIRQVAALTPGPYIHIGGDEVTGLSAADYAYFIQQAEQIIHKYGKQMIGWDDIEQANLSPGSVVQYWAHASQAASAAQQGLKVIMSPDPTAYLDMAYNPGTPGRTPYTSVEQAYDWDPATEVPGVAASQVYGVEGPVWGFPEWGGSPGFSFADAEFQAFPRMLALAELGWSPESSHSWASFSQRLGEQGVRLDLLGVNYYRAPDVPWTLSLQVDKSILRPGESATATATFRNDYGLSPANDVNFQLKAPSPLSVQPLTPTEFGAVPPGQSVTASWKITVPDSYQPVNGIDQSTISVTASAGKDESNEAESQLTIIGAPVQAPYLTADHTPNADALFSLDGNNFALIAGGRDAWHPYDEYATIYRHNILGVNGSISVKVVSQQNTSVWARAGIIVRNDLSAALSTGLVSVFITPGEGCAMTWDSNADGYNDQVLQALAGQTAPMFVRLQKAGTSYTGQCSANGTDWTTIGTANVTSASTIQDAGMFASAVNPSTRGLVQFTDFAVSNS